LREEVAIYSNVGGQTPARGFALAKNGRTTTKKKQEGKERKAQIKKGARSST
jgi:hypothetical protein